MACTWRVYYAALVIALTLRGSRSASCEVDPSSTLVTTFGQLAEELRTAKANLCIVSNTTVTFASSLAVAPEDNYSISGANLDSTLSGGRTTQLFIVFGTLELTGLAIQDGLQTNGLQVCASPFTDCAGGAIYVGSSGRLSLMSCTVQHNTASRGGAIMYLSVPPSIEPESPGVLALISGCHFSSNSALSGGGALQLEGNSKAVISHSEFTLNVARYGGAVQLFDGDPPVMSQAVTVTACRFTLNVADFGGALYIGTQRNATIDLSVFSANVVSGGGAGIFVQFHAAATVRNSSLSFNRASNGAGIYFKGGLTPLIVSGSTLISNVATSFGGGALLLMDAESTAVVSHSVFQDNSAQRSGAGALCIGAVSFLHTVFKSNTADDGGAVQISSPSASAKIDNCTFLHNKAQRGGALHVEDEALVTVQGHFESNKAMSGGAFYSALNGNIAVSNATFAQNSASNTGGAGYAGVATTSLARCVFQSNSAASGGGALLFDDTQSHEQVAILSENIFISNLASWGGAILVSLGGNANIAESTFTANSATHENGGAIVVEGTSIISRSHFLKNHAVGGYYAVGGALDVSGRVDLDWNIFQSNLARYSGSGALYVHKFGIAVIQSCAFHPNGTGEDSVGTETPDVSAVQCASSCPYAIDAGGCTPIGCLNCVCYSCECEIEYTHAPSFLPSSAPSLSKGHEDEAVNTNNEVGRLIIGVGLGAGVLSLVLVATLWRCRKTRRNVGNPPLQHQLLPCNLEMNERVLPISVSHFVESPSPMMICKTDGEVIVWSSGMVHATMIPAEDMVGKLLDTLPFANEDARKVVMEVMDEMRHKNPSESRLTMHLTTRTGNSIVEMRASEIQIDGSEKAVMFFGREVDPSLASLLGLHDLEDPAGKEQQSHSELGSLAPSALELPEDSIISDLTTPTAIELPNGSFISDLASFAFETRHKGSGKVDVMRRRALGLPSPRRRNASRGSSESSLSSRHSMELQFNETLAQLSLSRPVLTAQSQTPDMPPGQQPISATQDGDDEELSHDDY